MQPFRSLAAARSRRTTDENQGLRLGIGWILRGFRTEDRSRFTSRGPQKASCGVVFDRALATGVTQPLFGQAGSPPESAGVCQGALRALGFWWARVEDESKSRRQGLVVCRVTLPFEGFCDARPGVTLAPTFFGAPACQSLTIL